MLPVARRLSPSSPATITIGIAAPVPVSIHLVNNRDRGHNKKGFCERQRVKLPCLLTKVTSAYVLMVTAFSDIVFEGFQKPADVLQAFSAVQT